MINLSSTLNVVTGIPIKRGQLVGIELEYEKYNATALARSGVPITQWQIVADPSLRDSGIEFISQPTKLINLSKALSEAEGIVKGSKSVATSRCGVHVHLNMSDKTLRDLWNLCVLYTLAEPSIFRQFAKGREDSHFCVPTYLNNELIRSFYQDIKKLRMGSVRQKKSKKFTNRLIPVPRRVRRAIPDREQGIQPGEAWLGERDDGQEVEIAPPRRAMIQNDLSIFGCIKYSAMNLRTLGAIGTVEFRIHPGTSSMPEVRRWCDFLLNMQTVSQKFKDPLDIITKYEKGGIMWLRRQLGLRRFPVNSLDQEDAEDAATMMAGHNPVPWNKLEWSMK